ncbi:MAG: STAS domain-containing protein [Deltaproteobacteria bacterium]|nr:STAS domain-containing protein [Deltaproteobacteria bacterium]
MEMQQRKENSATVVSVKGRIDAVSAPEFEKALEDLISRGEKLLVIDFGELDYISSAGLRTILATTKKLKGMEGKLFLASLKEVVKEVFDISGFSSIIPIHGSVEVALAEL